MRGPRTHLTSPSTEVISFPRRTRVYVHTPDDKVFTAFLINAIYGTIPFWLKNPSRSTQSAQRVYIRMPNDMGVVSNIQPLERSLDINDILSEDYKCFVSVGSKVFLSAVLRRYNRETLPATSKPRAFVRMPDGNNTIYVGELDYDFGTRPSWLE